MTGRDFALRLLECLAVEAGNSVTDEQALLDRLAGVPLPPGPVLGVSARPSRLADVLTEGLRRPVAWVAVSDPQGYDFYERTTGHVC